MNAIRYLVVVLISVVSTAMAGSVDLGQCNGRSALWINPSLCKSTSSGMADQCTRGSQVLPFEMFEHFALDDSSDSDSMLSKNAQCNGRSALWISPSLCTDIASELSTCSSESQILDNSHDMFDTLEDGEQREMLTNFMTWSSLTRDMEMQKDHELCGDTSNNENMPWDIHMCPEGDIKLVHRTQPILGHSEYNFDTKDNQLMSASGKKKTIRSFGLPREKVRNFMTLLKPRPMHWRQKIRPELYP